MAGYRPKVNWFSPRAVREATPRVVEEQIGTNSFRFKALKKRESNRLDTPMMDQGLTYEAYRKQKSKSERRKVYNQWGVETGEVDDNNQVVHYNRNPYEWSANRWSNWSFGYSYGYNTVEDHSTLFVKEPESYLTPSTEQIKAKTNYWTEKDMRRIKELARVCYLKMIDDYDYIADDFKDRDNCNMDPNEWAEKKAIYDNVYTTYIPGFTPLEQAIAVNHKLRDEESREKMQKLKGVNDRPRLYEFRRSDYADPFINSQMDKTYINKSFKWEVLDNISLIGDMGSQFKVERDIGEKIVGYSDNHKSMLMNSYDQITMVNMAQRMLHGYNIRFLTKNLVVNVPVQTSEKKQKIIILLDFSGSMNNNVKQCWVNAILADRFRYVMKGEAEVFISYFVSSTDFLKFHHIKDEADVMRFWKFHDNRPNGSYTNIGRIVEYVAAEVKRGKLHNLKVDLSKELPEILIINDGEDEVGYKSFPYKVNAISLMRFSAELKTLCVATGGKQVFINADKSIVAHSSSGIETISA